MSESVFDEAAVTAVIMTVMSEPSGFDYTTRKNGEVVITHFGRLTVVLRGARAERFLEQIESQDDQMLMARVTGNYKRGNERPRRP